MFSPRSPRLIWLAAVAAVGALAGCTPKIGDKCVLSTDCSQRGDRVCDNAQPDGYCTVFNCSGNLCPDEAACVLFYAAVPGCAYDDRAPSRNGRSFCMAQCHADSDCRSGYVCADPRQAPWKAMILDDDQTQRICIVSPGISVSSEDAAVCAPAGPDVTLDASTEEGGGADAAGDGASDAAVADAADAIAADATADAEAAADGASDAGGADAGVDATLGDGGADASDATLSDAGDG